jgi:hypothetical protein
MFAVFDLQTDFHTQYACMFMIYVPTKFHIRTKNDLLLIAIKQKSDKILTLSPPSY